MTILLCAIAFLAFELLLGRAVGRCLKERA